MKVKLGKSFLGDLEHKMYVVVNEPDLQESYGINREQVEGFARAVGAALRSDRMLEIPDHMLECVKGEMENMADILRANESFDGNKVYLQAHSIERQIEKLKQ